jgi:APA family basic amino acid/polyamine antiporter
MDVIAERLFGHFAGNLLAVLTAISIAASVSAMIIAGPRVYFAMARDGVFFRRAAIIHPRYRTPAGAILAQSAWSSLLVLTGSFNQLIAYTGFAVVLFSGIAGVALFVLRRDQPDEPRGFRAWGYPLMPALFVAASALIVVNAIWRSPARRLQGSPSSWRGCRSTRSFAGNGRALGPSALAEACSLRSHGGASLVRLGRTHG